MKKVLMGLINFYRNYLSPLKGPTCRYYPSCSEYMLQAIDNHGVCRGLLKGTWRILRCNPYSKGGYDPVK